MILKLGKMTSQELADWFGVTKKAYTNSALKYLEKLSYFADYKRVYGGVEILNIYIDTYCKNYGNDDKYLNEEIERCIKEQQGIASISGMANKFKRDVEEYQSLSDSQVKRRVSHAASRNYGLFGDSIGGIQGCRDREWAIKLDDFNHYRKLSEEEMQMFIEITKIYYTDAADKLIQKKKLEEQLRNRELSIDDYFDKIDLFSLDMFPDILAKFTEKTGLKIVLATEYQIRAY